MITRTLLKTLCVAAIYLHTGVFNPAYAENPADRFQTAQQLLRNDQHDAALPILDELRKEYPGDVDYALARAQVLERLGRDDDSLQDLREGSHLAPDYEAVWRLRHAILSRQSDPRYQAEHDTVRQQSEQRFPQATWWRVPETPVIWTAFAGMAHDELSNQLQSWNNQFVELSREVYRQDQYAVRIARDARFEEVDYSFAARAMRMFSSGWSGGFGISLADSPAFQPELGYNVHAELPFAGNWVAGINYRRREYETATVGSLIGSVEAYVSDFRLAYNLNSSHLHGASNSLAHALTGNWYFRSNASVGLTLSTGEEVEAIGNGRILKTDVSGISISGRYGFNERWGLQWWLGSHKQGDYYRRRFLGMAVSIRL